MQFKSKYFQLVNLIIPVTVSSQILDTNFQQQPQLQSITGDKSIYIKAIEAYSSADVLIDPLSSNVVAAAADLANGVLTFRMKGTDLIRQIPLSRLRALASGAPANYFQWLFKNNYEIDWTNSRVTTLLVPGVGAGTTAPPFSYLFGVHYDYEPDAIDHAPVSLNVFTNPAVVRS